MNNKITRTAMFRGRMTPVVEISRVLGIDPETIWYRVINGIKIDRKPDRGQQNRGRARKRHEPRVKEPSLFDTALPYEDDLCAQIAVAIAVQRGSGLTFDEIGNCMGLCAQRIQQIERKAIRKLWRYAVRDKQEKPIKALLQTLDELRAESNAGRVEAESIGFTREEWLKSRSSRRRISQRLNRARRKESAAA